MIPEISEGEIDTCILTAQMGAKMNKKKIPGKEILRGILLLLLCLVVCFPFFMMISTSLKSYTEIKSPVFHLLPEKSAWRTMWSYSSQGDGEDISGILSLLPQLVRLWQY